VLDANIKATSKVGSELKLDADAGATASTGASLKLTSDVTAASKGEAKMTLNADAKIEAKGDVTCDGKNFTAVGAMKATMKSGASSFEANPQMATTSAPTVNVTGTGPMVQITAPMIKIG
jgi:hypothetical protein